MTTIDLTVLGIVMALLLGVGHFFYFPENIKVIYTGRSYNDTIPNGFILLMYILMNIVFITSLQFN